MVGVTGMALMVEGTPSRLLRDLMDALTGIGRLHWPFVPALAVLSAMHYLLAAIALRACAGSPLPLGRTTLAQFTAAAANRISPGGLGAAAANVSYLTRHGLPAVRAVAVVTALQITGALADALLLLVVLGVGVLVSGGALVGSARARVAELHVPLPTATPALVVGLSLAVIATTVTGWCLRSRLRRHLREVTELLRRPADLIVAASASGSTTLIMAVAFALSMLAIPGATAPGRMMTLLVVYLVGAAAGGFVPSPGGVGSTEAALVGLLVVTGVPAARAIQGVVLFRLITFWAPVPVGLIVARAAWSRSAPSTA